MSDKLLKFSTNINIDGRIIGANQPTFIIAEAGVSHLGEKQNLDPLIKMSLDAKVDAFKTQHFYTDKFISKKDKDWFSRISEKEVEDSVIKYARDSCSENNLTFLCTPHHEEVLSFLVNEIKVSAIKVGSGELGNFPLLKKIALTKKPIILSTGMYKLNEIKETIEFLYDCGCRELAILHCTTIYPTPKNLVNLSVIDQIRKIFSGPVGYSDHTEGNLVTIGAVCKGAAIIEKHITLFKNIPNAQDWKVSCDAASLKELVNDIRVLESALGGHEKTISEKEKKSKIWATKSITAKRNIEIGETIDSDSVAMMRPGNGLSAADLNRVIGKKVNKFINHGDLIFFDDLDN